jgi:hypothetical protein
MRALLLFLGACWDDPTTLSDSGADASRLFADAGITTDAIGADAPIADGTDEPFVLGDAGCGTAYPAGPYGTKVGDVMAPLAFAGKTDTNQNGVVNDDPTTTLCFGAYRQKPNVKAIAIIAAAMWCTPCQSEESGLRTMFAGYQNGGQVVMIEAILQNFATQMPTLGNLVTWTTQFKSPFDTAIDPSMSLLAYAPQVVWPIHIVVRASTMQITFEGVGTDLVTLKNEIDSVLGVADGGGD